MTKLETLKKDKCCGILGFIFGHNFDDMYDQKIEYQSLNDDLSSVKWAYIIMNHTQPVSKSENIYIKSVCSRCGREIERK